MSPELSETVSALLTAIGGGSAVIATQWLLAWMKGRDVRHVADRATDAQLEEHRDSLTFDLLSAAREELTAFRSELAALRPLQSRVAHLEEALDHVHALLHADGAVEWAAAARRGRAFLRRMRPGIGELRNMKQAGESAETLLGAGDHEGDDHEARLARRFEPKGEAE